MKRLKRKTKRRVLGIAKDMETLYEVRNSIDSNNFFMSMNIGNYTFKHVDVIILNRFNSFLDDEIKNLFQELKSVLTNKK